jgi:hypothetical protein
MGLIELVAANFLYGTLIIYQYVDVHTGTFQEDTLWQVCG